MLHALNTNRSRTVTIYFVKKDGSERRLVGRFKSRLRNGNFLYWDMEKAAFRQVRPSSIFRLRATIKGVLRTWEA